jgi:RNA polymerase sigma-70 factor (ECF subfamily)
MSDSTDHPSSAPGTAAWFATTHWTVVRNARDGGSTEAGVALEKLCQTYWYPLYAFVRRQGYSPHDAQDLTQEFFARLLAKDYLADVDRGKGKFRSFLLAALKHFLANAWDCRNAQKRGGSATHLSIDAASAEQRYGLEPADPEDAERIFERRWALTLLDQVLDRLKSEFAAAGKADHFDQLKVVLTADKGTLPYVELARSLGMTEGAVKVAVHRLRQRYRELLRAEIAHTVSAPEEVDGEIRHLFGVLAG